MTTRTKLLPEELTEEFQRDHDNWDYEHAEVRHAVREPRAVFSIRLTKKEMDTIGAAAEAAGVTTSEFIRNASIAAATGGSASLIQASIAELREAVDRAEAALDELQKRELPAGERRAG